MGCCTLGEGAVACPGGFGCCQAGTKCVLINGTVGYNALFNCTAPSGEVLGNNRAVCKSGPPLPMSPTLKNVVYIGDSLTLGFSVHVRANLSDIALVQRGVWGQDGGDEETAYGLYCLDFFLHSAAGDELSPDLILFNWGMHNGPIENATFPGQLGLPTNYSVELGLITEKLVAYAAQKKSLLAFVHVSPISIH